MGQTLSNCYSGLRGHDHAGRKYRVDHSGEGVQQSELPSWEQRPKLDYRDFLFSKIQPATAEGLFIYIDIPSHMLF